MRTETEKDDADYETGEETGRQRQSAQKPVAEAIQQFATVAARLEGVSQKQTET